MTGAAILFWLNKYMTTLYIVWALASTLKISDEVFVSRVTHLVAGSLVLRLPLVKHVHLTGTDSFVTYLLDAIEAALENNEDIALQLRTITVDTDQGDENRDLVKLRRFAPQLEEVRISRAT